MSESYSQNDLVHEVCPYRECLAALDLHPELGGDHYLWLLAGSWDWRLSLLVALAFGPFGDYESLRNLYGSVHFDVKGEVPLQESKFEATKLA